MLLGGADVGLSAQTIIWFQRDPGGTTTYVAPELQFRRSSRCATGGCAEVAITPRSVVVRSSEDPLHDGDVYS